MRRREFIALIGSATAWPLAARAQQSERVRRIGVLMGYPDTEPEGQAGVAAFQEGLQQLGWGDKVRIDTRWAPPGNTQALHRFAIAVEETVAPILSSGELESVIAAQAREPNGGFIVMPDAFTDTYRVEIISLAARYALPAVYPFHYWVENGGLLSYGVDQIDNFRRAAIYADRILKGEKPADLPVQTPSKFQLAVNLKTAKALDRTFCW